MNVYAIVVLVALLAHWALELAADLLNLRALESPLPREFEGVYDAERYAKSQAYTRARTRFGILPRTFDLVVLLVFWFAGGFAALDRAVRELDLGTVPSGLLYVGALVVGHSVLHLPFRWYATFVLEERFGFNRTTVRTFFADLAKGLVLGALLGGVLLAAVLFFFERAGELAWVWAFAAVSLFTVVLQFLAPTLIFPLFNRFTPLADGETKGAILAYAQRVGFPLRDLFVVDGSRRSTKANAFFTGFGRNKRVALFDTLVARHGTGELVAVVAHEIGHFKKKHVLQGLALSIAHSGVLFFLLSLFLEEDALFAAFGVEGRPPYAGLVFFALLYTPIELVLGFFLNALSRRNEFEADRFAAETTGAPEDMAAALERLSAESLANLTPHPFYVALNYSHPPVLARIAALRAARPS